MKLIFGPELYYVGAPQDSRRRRPHHRPAAVSLLPAVPDRRCAILMVLATFYLIYKTSFGLKVRAVRRNRAMSGCLGIDTARIDMMIFMFGSGLAGIAGAVLAPIKSVSTTMGFTYAVDSYMVLVLGGVGNLLGRADRCLPHRRGRDIARLQLQLRDRQAARLRCIVIAIRVVPRGIFGYHERR